jgi:hypothetical protein
VGSGRLEVPAVVYRAVGKYPEESLRSGWSLLEAAGRSQSATAPDTVREIHSAVLGATEGELDDDATAVCLAITQP